ncbi:FecCD family ABC transporter permease [Cohnella thailandensis]|uniref:Probable heme-iron transport system permease protein IsdF n=1 Tax=Cohnella thailandensis TaxID=557557 RepID=A0A841SXL8_9BACL|nr:iron ABC transporter permease [Cohnella thailandensis]MBB6634935.1 iron ABC transporter permease [Cohnella thailandensis]MBP1975843.1 iron complex transport system permease protein [Cohnella thailandensis]
MVRRFSVFLVISALLVFTAVFSMMTGSIKVGFNELIRGLLFGGSEQVEIIRDLRFPRIVVSMLTGASLAVSGVLLQAVMRNPLAEPGIIGISSGAGLVSLTVVTIFPMLYFWSPLFSVLGGALACFLVYSLSWRSQLNPLRLILVGIAINATFTGLGQSFNYRGSYAVTTVNQAVSSIFTMKIWEDVHILGLFGGIGLLLSFPLGRWCNMLAFQDETARNLGLGIERVRLAISAVAVLLASVATAIGGLILFVGLLVPHIGRTLIGSNYKLLIPFSAVGGALLVLAADTIGRTALAPAEIPASIIMAVIGGPFLIIMLKRSDKLGNK